MDDPRLVGLCETIEQVCLDLGFKEGFAYIKEDGKVHWGVIKYGDDFAGPVWEVTEAMLEDPTHVEALIKKEITLFYRVFNGYKKGREEAIKEFSDIAVKLIDGETYTKTYRENKWVAEKVTGSLIITHYFKDEKVSRDVYKD